MRSTRTRIDTNTQSETPEKYNSSDAAASLGRWFLNQTEILHQALKQINQVGDAMPLVSDGSPPGERGESRTEAPSSGRPVLFKETGSGSFVGENFLFFLASIFFGMISKKKIPPFQTEAATFKHSNMI